MRLKRLYVYVFLYLILGLSLADRILAGDKLLSIEKKISIPSVIDGEVHHRCLTPAIGKTITFPVERKNPWSLPSKALSSSYQKNINILVLRFNFKLESPDNINTTGLGHMDLSRDSADFFDANGHYIDPPPRDSLYFDSHMKAMSRYYEKVSEGKLTFSWDIFPPGNDSIYELPQEMSYYAACLDTLPVETGFKEVVKGLERYFVDCLQLSDTTSPEIDFSQYESIFLFHAGADQQNNIGFPQTCSDMFTGFIRFGDSIQVDDTTIFVGGLPVDSGAVKLRTALLMPETASQDNRATALNAVIAHEFGHQLGLPDLYRTGNFRTQIGDFALMDNNGGGTGIEFPGFTVGSTKGVNPVFPCAWSRAFLGFIEVRDYRQGDDIYLVAAEVVSDSLKAARIPISDDEYYLIENRIQEFDGKTTFILADSNTSVIQGLVDTNRTFTGEYDHLMPGSGVIIYHVDESVARADRNNNGVSNFFENQLQWDHENRFIRIVEADGIVDLGGFYNRGFGSEDDLYREDRNNSLTPNSNPPSIDNTGNDSHIRITNIRRDTAIVNLQLTVLDSVVRFDVETDGLVENFPVRIGYPINPNSRFILIDSSGVDTLLFSYPSLAPLADDINKDGKEEIIAASGFIVSVMSTSGDIFIRTELGCDTCIIYIDSSHSRYEGSAAGVVDGREYARGEAFVVPVYFLAPNFLTTAPATGDFGLADSAKLVAVGFLYSIDSGGVVLHSFNDDNFDAQADNYMTIPVTGIPVAINFGDILYIVTDKGNIYFKDSYDLTEAKSVAANYDTLYGATRLNSDLILLTETNLMSEIKYYSYSDSTVTTFPLSNSYNLGPVIADLNLDGLPEIICASSAGEIIFLTMDTNSFSPTTGAPAITELNSKNTGRTFLKRPVIADVDLDGYPDVLLAGVNEIHAYDDRLISKINYPHRFYDKFPNDSVIASPIVADIEGGGLPEIISPTAVGNIYSFGSGDSYGFPLSAGEASYGSALVISDSAGNGMLGYSGDDGWFYLWDFWASPLDTSKSFWRMAGADPSGSYNFNQGRLPAITQYENLLADEDFFNYPNPVTDGETTIRYFLGKQATSVNISIFDMSGFEIISFAGSTSERENEEIWKCNDITPGIYRCVIRVDFGDVTENAFTDIAVIR